MPETISLEPEFYPIERLLIAGPRADALPMADRAKQAGHNVTLLLPDEEIPETKTSHRVLGVD